MTRARARERREEGVEERIVFLRVAITSEHKASLGSVRRLVSQALLRYWEIEPADAVPLADIKAAFEHYGVDMSQCSAFRESGLMDSRPATSQPHTPD